MIFRMPLLDRLETVGTTIVCSWTYRAFFKSRVRTWPIRRTLLSMEPHIIGFVRLQLDSDPTVAADFLGQLSEH
jgi:hypothetical protein